MELSPPKSAGVLIGRNPEPDTAAMVVPTVAAARVLPVAAERPAAGRRAGGQESRRAGEQESRRAGGPMAVFDAGDGRGKAS